MYLVLKSSTEGPVCKHQASPLQLARECLRALERSEEFYFAPVSLDTTKMVLFYRERLLRRDELSSLSNEFLPTNELLRIQESRIGLKENREVLWLEVELIREDA